MVKEKTACEVLGVEIGYMEGWDSAGNFSILLYNLMLNEKGKAFLHNRFTYCENMTIDFESGKVYVDDRIVVQPDWSVFNIVLEDGEVG